jgi:hypothetical protein
VPSAITGHIRVLSALRRLVSIAARMHQTSPGVTASVARENRSPIRRIVAAGSAVALGGGLFSWAGAGIASAEPLPTPQSGYGSYHKEYFINNVPKYSTRQVMTQFNSNVDAYFTFTGCGLHLSLNQICQLDTPAGHAPVQVIALNDTGFALKSLPGHPEGAGRTIRFLFVRADTVDQPTFKALFVDAWGPTSGLSNAGPFNSATLAQYSWQRMADNINSRFPQDPPCDPNRDCPV